MSKEITAIVALGANLGKPRQQIEKAFSAINQLEGVRLKAISPLFQTKAVGLTDQPDFINAVVLLHTILNPQQLLQALQKLELDFGRERTIRFGPRTLDLDIVDYNGLVVNDQNLILPHPRAHERAFVMEPLARIVPNYQVGKHGKAAELAVTLLRQKPDEMVTILA